MVLLLIFVVNFFNILLVIDVNLGVCLCIFVIFDFLVCLVKLSKLVIMVLIFFDFFVLWLLMEILSRVELVKFVDKEMNVVWFSRFLNGWRKKFELLCSELVILFRRMWLLFILMVILIVWFCGIEFYLFVSFDVVIDLEVVRYFLVLMVSVLLLLIEIMIGNLMGFCGW